MKVNRLYMGSIAGPLGPATPFNGYLIDHPKGLTLVDTGFGTTLALIGNEEVEDPNAVAGELVYGDMRLPWIRRTSIEALADHGIEAGDVQYIINTHVGDHSGDNHMFPHATFFIQEPEAEWARKTKPHGSQSLGEWDFPGAKLELLPGEDVEILPGLRCLFTPGHTPGHQSVLLEHEGQKTLFCGDAIYTENIWDNPGQIEPGHPAFQMQVQLGEPGLEMWRESVAKLASFQPDQVHFAHDSHFKHAH
jgi:glyoxylase-like metal-dependent hydrolase (beta-lactamase superfamily II)